jgi:GNAT superfamily N-acetyltransferase
MITLCKLFHSNRTLFTDHPELNHIWEVPVLQESARRSYEEWRPFGPEGVSTGDIFTIDQDGVPIGIIGWKEEDPDADILSDTIRLQYYGIIPSRRGRGYGEQAMKLFLEYLAHNNETKNRIFLSESLSIGRMVAPRILAHFKGMGFEEFNAPHYGRNAGFSEVLNLRIRIPGK